MYCCKYCSKHAKDMRSRGTLLDSIDDMERMDANAKERVGDQ